MIKNSVALANVALKKIAAPVITSFDDTTEAGKAITRAYYIILELVLSEHEWSFAQKETALAVLDVDPIITERNLPYVYQYPSDFVKVNYKTSGAKVSLQDDGIHSDHNSLQIIYTRLVDSPITYPASFAMAFATRLAHELTFDFTESRGLAEKLLKQYEGVDLPRAIFVDSTQGNMLHIAQGDWEVFRNYGAGDSTPNVE